MTVMISDSKLHNKEKKKSVFQVVLRVELFLLHISLHFLIYFGKSFTLDLVSK